MKAIDFVLVLALGLLLGSVATCLVNRQADPDPDYWVSKAAYDQAVKKANAQTDAALVVIAQKDKVIKVQSAIIEDITAQAGKPSAAELAKDKAIATLQKQVAAYEAQGDLATALAASKAESKAWAEKYTLAVRTHQESVISLNREWQVKFDAQVSISEAWKASYEREHALRLSAESLIGKQPKDTKLAKWLRRGGYALAFAIGNLSHR